MSPELFAGTHNTVRTEALTALTLLGFPKASADKALDKVLRSSETELNVEDLIKQTLKVI